MIEADETAGWAAYYRTRFSRTLALTFPPLLPLLLSEAAYSDVVLSPSPDNIDYYHNL